MRHASLFLVAFALTLPGSLAAQVVRNAAERAADWKQIEDNKKALARDQAEIDGFAQLLSLWDNAVATRNQEARRSVHSRLITAMQREVEQSASKAEQAKRELRQSTSELRSERREVRQDRRAVQDDEEGSQADLLRDRLNRGDDRRDRRDDRKDLEAATARATRQAEILQQISGGGNLNLDDAAAVARQRGLINEFAHLLHADYEATERELQEDVRELREDRRETGQDRRKRKP